MVEPFGLWVRGAGDLAALTADSVAVVGARAATAYGEHVAGELAVGCSVAGWTVVSGRAYGIDARRTAARWRPTAPRSACSPAASTGSTRPGTRRLLRRILERGALVSEAAPGCAPSKSRFLVRNRLIAALTRGTVVVEAAVRSGSLNTARWAATWPRGDGCSWSGHLDGVGRCARAAPAGTALLVTAAAEVVEHLLADRDRACSPT